MSAKKFERSVITMTNEEKYFSCVLLNKETKPEFFHRGYWPEADLQVKMAVSFLKVFEMAPPQSTLWFRMDLLPDGYRFQILLNCCGGSINADGYAPDPIDAFQDCLERIHLKVKKWHDGQVDKSLAKTTSEVRTPVAIEQPKQHHVAQSPRVLIVDDSPLAARLMESCLKQLGCVTQTATNGRDAIRHMTTADFDLLVLDWQMPELSGEETLIHAQDLISRDPSFKLPWLANQLPVLTYSGENIESSLFPRCENFEFIGHLSKDANYGDMRNRASKVLQSLRAA